MPVAAVPDSADTLNVTIKVAPLDVGDVKRDLSSEHDTMSCKYMMVTPFSAHARKVLIVRCTQT